MPPEPIHLSALGIDLSPRVVTTTAVAASPALAAETVIATIPAFSTLVPVVNGIIVSAWVAYTVGATGTAVQLRVRQTNIVGAVVANSGALSRAAASVQADNVEGLDTAPLAAGTPYVVTMTVAGATGASTVSALLAFALVV